MLFIDHLNYNNIIDSYGTDYLRIKLGGVDCASSHYLSIAQCSYSTDIDSGCINSNSYDATVYCCKLMNIIILEYLLLKIQQESGAIHILV